MTSGVHGWETKIPFPKRLEVSPERVHPTIPITGYPDDTCSPCNCTRRRYTAIDTMDWDDPLRHLAPISEHPVKNSLRSSELSAISDGELASLKVNVKLDQFGRASARHNRTASILGSFFQFLDDEGRNVLATEILAWIDDEDNLFKLANHLVGAILLPCNYLVQFHSPITGIYTYSLSF